MGTDVHTNAGLTETVSTTNPDYLTPMSLIFIKEHGLPDDVMESTKILKFFFECFVNKFLVYETNICTYRHHQRLAQCFSTAGPRPGTGPREVLLEFVILVF